ncbi:hypothetical protein SAY86_014358 [Trapa natans]|uniref:RING-type E3 ubiquitin transferase n=1 Tax=Trapa natans TaxID=22666 RepID=A0AAN7KY76_TRANT|nr:hypothetical protein SAY86_014358 [Trapa natans]
MLINIYNFEAKLRSPEVAAAAASAAAEVKDLVRFDIYYYKRTLELSCDSKPEVTGGRTGMKYFLHEKDSYTFNPTSWSCDRNQLMIVNSDDDNMFTDLAVAAVPRRWVEETASRLSWVARHVSENYADSDHELVVKIDVMIVTAKVKANESRVPQEIDEIFRRLKEDAILLADAVYEPATILSVEALADVLDVGELDADECCSICLDKYDNSGGGVVAMPCSHKYHFRCIFQWLKMKHECPLCRFGLPYETVVLRRPKIQNLIDMNAGDGRAQIHH